MNFPDSPARELPFTPSDGFILALDGLCNRAWGGGLLANSELEIEGQPDANRLKWLAAEMPRRFSFLRATLKRGFFLQAPRWQIHLVNEGGQVPLHFHRLESVPGFEPSIPSLADLRTRLLGMRLHIDGAPPHLRIDVVRHCSDRWTFLITWSHLILDGVGIELLIKDMARLWDEPSVSIRDHPPIHPIGTVWERFQDSEAVGKYLFDLSGKHFPSASRGMCDRGSPQHLVETFTEGEGALYRESLKRAGGDLMTSFFHAIIAARAHRALLHSRGYKNPTLVLGVPAQLRAKHDNGEPVTFQNHMTMLYYVLEGKDLDSITHACRLVMKQNIEHLRKKHHLSFSSFLSLSRHLPGLTTIHLVRWQQSGELVSLFHSWTGTVAQGLSCAFGGRILNGFHIPGVTAPPGSGLFFSDCQGLFSVVLSWVDTCLNPREVQIMRHQWRHDLLGEEAP